MAVSPATITACSLAASSNMSLISSYAESKRPRSTGLFVPHQLNKTPSFLGVGGTNMLHLQMNHTEFCSNGPKPSILPIVRCSSNSGTEKHSEVIDLEETKHRKENTVLDSLRVQSLLATICDTTSVEEVKLELPGFRLYVKRDIAEKSTQLAVPSPLPVQTSSIIHQSNESATTTSLAISKPDPPSSVIQRIIDTASDEGLVILQSPKVGYFRRSRTIKGKRAPPSCKEKQEVKEGQVLCYIEQLGGEIPIESDVSGEVIKILREDGEPVGYADPLIAILPSFPGIKKLQ